MTPPSPTFIPLPGYERFEATTQIMIAEIQKRGLPLEIIDAGNNLIAVTYNHREYIIHEGTISDANSLIAYWISNDKWMTKLFLKRRGIHHAKGILLDKNDDDPSEIQNLQLPLVVKPMDTDHGIAVSSNLKTTQELQEAIHEAFKYSKKVIIEEYFEGREYRFLVIDEVVRAIAYRIPANVTGDGRHTILELIDEKNKDRGTDYTRPLLKIIVDGEVKRHLKAQNLSPETILKEDRKIYLRQNSNLSTGGDSIDVTDEMPDFYKQVAVESAKAADLKIAGIDIIIRDTGDIASKDNYIVVELNAPAMLSMHDFPYIGKNRNVAKYVLDAILKK